MTQTLAWQNKCRSKVSLVIMEGRPTGDAVLCIPSVIRVAVGWQISES